MLVKAGLADTSTGEIYRYTDHINFNDINNSIMDLRNYGIKGNWQDHEIYGSQTAMISEIEKKINQFNFMLNNEDKIKNAYSIKIDQFTSKAEDKVKNAGGELVKKKTKIDQSTSKAEDKVKNAGEELVKNNG